MVIARTGIRKVDYLTRQSAMWLYKVAQMQPSLCVIKCDGFTTQSQQPTANVEPPIISFQVIDSRFHLSVLAAPDLVGMMELVLYFSDKYVCVIC